jgi:hypothetical protein
MKENEYTIENLIETFAKHAEEFEEIQNEHRKRFMRCDPCEELPNHLKDNVFNLSRALCVICKEIKRIWEL